MKLTSTGVDFAGKEFVVVPKSQVVNSFGAVSETLESTVTFTSKKSGLEIITASFEHVETEFQLIVDGKEKSILYEVEGEGAFVFSPDKPSYEVGTIMTIKAVPEPGWKLERRY